MRNSRRGIPAPCLFLLAAVLLSACGSSATSNQTAASNSPFPPRPSDVDITRVDPCAALSPSQRTELGLDRGKSDQVNVGGTQSPTCRWVNDESGLLVSVQTIAVGAEQALSRPGSTLRTINGFGAVENVPTELGGRSTPPFCQLTVDANSGQTVRVQVQTSNVNDAGNAQAIEAVCRRANDITGSVMTTLVGQQR